MTTHVVDASVIVKWVLPDRKEDDTDHALRLLGRVRTGEVDLVQPPHWLAEVAAVVTRLQPQVAPSVVELLHALDLETDAEPGTYTLACEIAGRVGVHVFDTLYHAVALRAGLDLITADTRYHRKARVLGSIVMLKEWGAR